MFLFLNISIIQYHFLTAANFVAALLV